MTLLYTDPRFTEHLTGPGHPERPERIGAIIQRLHDDGLWDRCRHATWEPLSHAQVAEVHAADYVESIEAFALHGGGRVEEDTLVSAETPDVARLAAGAAVDAVRRVLAGEDRQAFCVGRPPGHHALRRQPMGFCLFNNVALAAKWAIDHGGLDRVLIIDWDVHHGNGTQELFYEDEQVGLLSVHRWPFYPGTGSHYETGHGPGLGTILNVPLDASTSPGDYHAAFANGLETMLTRMRPQLLLISAGFDAHVDDPLGSLGLAEADFVKLTHTVQQAANDYCQGRLISVLEGGYNLDALSASVSAHVGALLAADDEPAAD